MTTSDRRRGTVAGLVVYPIKGCGGVPVEQADIARHGLALDRRWMLVDDAGTFISQRSTPRMALVRLAVNDDAWAVRAPAMPQLDLPLTLEDGPRVEAEVWSDACTAIGADSEANAWFSEFLERSVRVAYLPENELRRAGPVDGDLDVRVGFADAAPILLTSTSSLGDLNRRAGTDLPMDRFRPNIVVDGFGAFAEDGWKRIRIADAIFLATGGCARCAVTTVDQDTGERGAEPLKTLSTFRKVRNKVYFGQHLAQLGNGTVRVGDVVDVLE